MAMRRTTNTPAFAVMRSRQVGSAPPGLVAARFSAEPHVIRLPRGYALLLAAIAVGMVLLAYWVGYSRGLSAAAPRSEPSAGLPAVNEVVPPGMSPGVGPGVGPGVVPATTGAPTQATAPPVVLSREQDPRVPGLNYFILAHYPEAEARRLVQFLREAGVEVSAIRWHNEGIFQVVALRGFTREELASDARKAYENRLRELGKRWNTPTHRGATDLRDLYPARYTGR